MIKVAIFGQYYQENTSLIVDKVIEVLEHHKAAVFFEKVFFEKIKSTLDNPELFEIFENHTQLNNSFSFLISIGGDGTILRAATFVRDKNIPIVGVNSGRLGFLATIQINEI
ncbi:MAG TPA: NAD(+) kinase, partial [Flavobacterium sp.]|nr:NAD(+) kinase [Flavobacterium sp.]